MEVVIVILIHDEWLNEHKKLRKNIYFKKRDKMDYVRKFIWFLSPVLDLGILANTVFVNPASTNLNKALKNAFPCFTHVVILVTCFRHSSAFCSLRPHGIFAKKVAAYENFNSKQCSGNIWNLVWPYVICYTALTDSSLLTKFYNSWTASLT